MIAENPMANSGEWVLHTRKPAMLLRVIDITDWSDADRIENMKQFNVYSLTEVNGLHFLLVPGILFHEIELKTQRDADQLAGLMRRAADWWHAYIKFEEKNAQQLGSNEFNVDL